MIVFLDKIKRGKKQLFKITIADEQPKTGDAMRKVQYLGSIADFLKAPLVLIRKAILWRGPRQIMGLKLCCY